MDSKAKSCREMINANEVSRNHEKKRGMKHIRQRADRADSAAARSAIEAAEKAIYSAKLAVEAANRAEVAANLAKAKADQSENLFTRLMNAYRAIPKDRLSQEMLDFFYDPAFDDIKSV